MGCVIVGGDSLLFKGSMQIAKIEEILDSSGVSKKMTKAMARFHMGVFLTPNYNFKFFQKRV